MSLPLGRPAQRALVARYAQLLWERGWVANHDGNASLRVAQGRFLATPTAESKRLVGPDDLIVVDLKGGVHEGRRRIFSEWSLHAAAYEARPDAQAVLHAHPPHASAAGLVGAEVDTCVMPEAVVSLGQVPTAALALPGAEAAAALRACLDDADAVLLPGNGVLTLGDDLEQAYLRMELVEQLAQILALARAQGRPARLAPAQIESLLAKRAKAGLGRAGRQGEGGATSARADEAARLEAARRVALAQAQAKTGDAQAAQRVAEAVVARLREG